ncbi:MAG TPA: HAD hydrolase-like protein, partial [Polyangiaceae bacterium]|nr:HAD hydrolase-like protein [Polyangiaceae bacterium]
MTASSGKNVRGALLDVDGTLLDSNAAHASAYHQALEEEGMRIALTRIRPLIGMGGEKLLPALGVEASSRVGERVTRRKKEIFERRFLPHLRPFPAARDLLDRMKSHRLALIVATSAADDELRGLLRQADVDDLVDGQSS